MDEDKEITAENVHRHLSNYSISYLGEPAAPYIYHREHSWHFHGFRNTVMIVADSYTSLSDLMEEVAKAVRCLVEEEKETT